MKSPRRALTATATMLLLSLAVANTPVSATTGSSDTTIPSVIKVSRRYSLNMDKVIAGALHMTVKQLRSDINSGFTLGEIAAAHGSSANAIAALVKAKLSALVTKAERVGVIARSRAAQLRITLGRTVSGLMNRAVATSRHGDAPEYNLLSDQIVADLFGITLTQLRTELRMGSSILSLATDRGVTLDTLIAALTADVTAKITSAVTSGAITLARGDELLAGLTTRISSYINRVGPARGRYNKRRSPRPLKLSSDEVVARIIGITENQLETERNVGASYATIAANHSVSLAVLKAGITAEAQARIATALAAGRITDAQATAYLTSLPTWVDSFVNHVPLPEPKQVIAFRLVSLSAAATFIGITPDALKSQLHMDLTIAQVAINYGKSVDALTTALVADSTTRIAAEVATGRMTQSTATILLANVAVAVDWFVNQSHHQ